MRCSVPNCFNNAARKFTIDLVTFHSFPTDPNIRQAWIEATGINNWEPGCLYSICSEHFRSSDFYVTKCGSRVLKPGAVPVASLCSKELDTPATTKVCRICLSMDLKMYALRNYELGEMYHQITGIMWYEEDNLPQQFCWECAGRLLSCYKFFEKALRSHRFMMDALRNAECITLKDVKSIRQHSSTLKSNLIEKVFESHEFDPTIDDSAPTQANIEDVNDESIECADLEDLLPVTRVEMKESDDDMKLSEVVVEKEKEEKVLVIVEKKGVKKIKVVKKMKVKGPPKKDEENPVSTMDIYKTADVKRRRTTDGRNEPLINISTHSYKEQISEIQKPQDTTAYKNAPYKCNICYRGFQIKETYNAHIVKHSELSHERNQSINREQNLGKKFFGMKTEDINDDMVEYLEDLDEFGEGDVEYLEGIEDQGTGSDIRDSDDDTMINESSDNKINDHMYAKTMIKDHKDDNGVIEDHKDDSIMTNTDVYEDEENELNEETDSEDFLVYEIDDNEFGGLSDKLDSTEGTAKVIKVKRSNDVKDINDTLNDEKSDDEVFEDIVEIETTETNDVAEIVEIPDEKNEMPSFTVEYLTIEEQLAEMEKRKKTPNYLTSAYKCPDCYKGFICERTYNSHRLRHTNAHGDHSCMLCKLHFRSRINLTRHRLSHTKRYSCEECGFKTIQQTVAISHRNWHVGFRFTCPQCDKTFEKRSSYFFHLRVKHPSDFVCQMCGFSFVSESGITLHKKLKHSLQDLDILEDGPLCELCNIRFVDQAALNQHLAVSLKHTDGMSRQRNEPKIIYRKQIISCEKCGFKNEGARAYIKHFNESHPGETPARGSKLLICELCGSTLKGTNAYLSHFRRKHSGQVPTLTLCGVKDVECELCGVRSMGARAHLSHFSRAHPGETPKLKKYVMCELCGKMFPNKVLLKQHSWVHTGVRPFKCDVCGKSFTTKPVLMDHRKRHTEPITYPCEVCGKLFSYDANRRRHMLIHENIRPYKCEICAKTFIMPCDKRAHIEHAHDKKPWPKRNGTRPRRQATKQPVVKVVRLPETKMDEE